VWRDTQIGRLLGAAFLTWTHDGRHNFFSSPDIYLWWLGKRESHGLGI
jgi:hypothetical protein